MWNPDKRQPFYEDSSRHPDKQEPFYVVRTIERDKQQLFCEIAPQKRDKPAPIEEDERKKQAKLPIGKKQAPVNSRK